MARDNGNNDELNRYRQAAEDALQQLDWCIGYLHGIRKVDISRALAKNRSYIRTRLLEREEQPVPAQRTDQE
jgi:hypothetical protein